LVRRFGMFIAKPHSPKFLLLYPLSKQSCQNLHIVICFHNKCNCWERVFDQVYGILRLAYSLPKKGFFVVDIIVEKLRYKSLFYPPCQTSYFINSLIGEIFVVVRLVPSPPVLQLLQNLSYFVPKSAESASEESPLSLVRKMSALNNLLPHPSPDVFYGQP